jgi:hypothetical protein
MATPSFSYSLPQVFTFPFEALEERAPLGGVLIFLQRGSGEIKKVVCLKARAFPCFDLEEVRLWGCQTSSTSRSRVARHQGNVRTYVTDRFHAEIYFRLTRQHTEYALS